MKNSVKQLTNDLVQDNKDFIITFDGTVSEYLLSEAKNQENGWAWYLNSDEEVNEESVKEITRFIETEFNYSILNKEEDYIRDNFEKIGSFGKEDYRHEFYKTETEYIIEFHDRANANLTNLSLQELMLLYAAEELNIELPSLNWDVESGFILEDPSEEEIVELASLLNCEAKHTTDIEVKLDNWLK